MIRITFLVLLIFCALFVSVWLALPFAFVFAMRWQALEFLPLAVLVDGYFAAVAPWPFFTIAAFLMIMTAELAKQHLQFS